MMRALSPNKRFYGFGQSWGSTSRDFTVEYDSELMHPFKAD